MITSASNSRIKNIIQLRTSAKARKTQNRYVVEGIRMFQETPDARIQEVFVSESFVSSKDGEKALRGKEYDIVSDDVFKKMSDTVTPQGIMCIVEMMTYDLDSLIEKEEVKVMVLESLQDPGNLGTIIRTSEAAGFDFILADKSTVDVYNPKVIRSTMGAIYRVPVLYTNDLIADLAKLKNNNIVLYAAHLMGTSSYKEQSYSRKTAILIGNEGNGLSEEISSMADVLVKIPMKGKVESLNAAVAAALMMFEVE